MSDKNEYINLYQQHSELIDNNSTQLINSKRQQAFEKFAESGFPEKRNEEYKRIDIATLFGYNYGLNLHCIKTGVKPYELFKCEVPKLKTTVQFMVNDQFYKREENEKNILPQGVILDSLRSIASTSPQLIEKYYNKLNEKGDAIGAFNTMFAQDGLLLYIPKGVIIEEPIQLINISTSKIPLLLNRRVLIIAEDGSKAKILICDHTIENVKYLSTQVSEVFVGRNAQIEIYEIEETNPNNTRLSQLYISQQASSTTHHSVVTLMNGVTRNNINVTFNGEGAETKLLGLSITDKEQHVDNFTLIDHQSAHCRSNETYKYVLNDSSTASFYGRILIQPGAQQTVSHQTNRNLCITGKAKMYTQPQLEIYADDVKCSHGATVGQLDEQALFYMQQRGIPLNEARQLLMQAFTSDVINSIELEGLRERLNHLVEQRFRGELNHCRGCSLCR